jgi:hypothetical protein
MAAPPMMVWRGHASARLVLALLIAHAIGLVWFCSSWDRVRLVTMDFRELPNEDVLRQPPDALRVFDYVEDDPSELRHISATAEATIRGAASDGERMRRLADYIYALRRHGHRDADGEPQVGFTTLFEQLNRGDIGSCAQDATILAAFWRSLGGHSRGVRWATVEGATPHFAVELYSTSLRRWMYYDMNLNGYAADDGGLPAPVTTLRARMLAGEPLNLTANATAHDWSTQEFQEFLADYPIEWYVLNNSVLAFEPGRRFGRFHTLYPVLARLPYPLDRIADNIVGTRDRRLVLDGKIQIAGLLTFSGARLFLAYLACQIVLCAATLLIGRRRR